MNNRSSRLYGRTVAAILSEWHDVYAYCNNAVRQCRQTGHVTEQHTRRRHTSRLTTTMSQSIDSHAACHISAASRPPTARRICGLITLASAADYRPQTLSPLHDAVSAAARRCCWGVQIESGRHNCPLSSLNITVIIASTLHSTVQHFSHTVFNEVKNIYLSSRNSLQRC